MAQRESGLASHVALTGVVSESPTRRSASVILVAAANRTRGSTSVRRRLSRNAEPGAGTVFDRVCRARREGTSWWREHGWLLCGIAGPGGVRRPFATPADPEAQRLHGVRKLLADSSTTKRIQGPRVATRRSREGQRYRVVRVQPTAAAWRRSDTSTRGAETTIRSVTAS